MNRNDFSNNNGGMPSGNPGNSGQNRNNRDEVERRIDLKKIFAAFKQHKKLILGSIFLCMVGALVYSYQVTPVYQGIGSIMIQETSQDRSAENGELANLLNKTYAVGANSTLENELQFLRSRQISMNMASEILDRQRMENGEIYPILWKNYPEDSTVVSQDTLVNRIQKKINFSQKATEANLVQVTFESPSRLEAKDMVDLAMETYTNTSTNINRKTANSAVEFLEEERNRLKNKLQESEQHLRSFMNQSNVVEVDAQTQELITSLSQLETERQTVKADLVAVNSAIEEYKKRLDSIKPGLSEQYSEVSGPRLERYQYQLAELQTRKTLYLSKNPGLENDENPPEEFKKLNREIEYMKEEIRKLTGELTSEKDQYLGMLSNSNEGVTQDVSEINQRLVELQAEKSQYEAKAEVLDERLQEDRQFFSNLPDNMMDLARLRRDHEINEQMYRTVSDQYNEMMLWQKTQFGVGRVVDEAYVPQEPVKPNRKLYLLVSFFIGGIFSIGYLTIRNSFGDKITSIEELRARDYPVLGIIPVLQKATKKKVSSSKINVVDREISSDLISVHDPISPGAEAFRRMNYNIIYAQSDDDSGKTILITSSTKGEGKTTTVSNLAVLLAEAKKKVIVVDTDLGKPSMHNMFGIDRSPGVVDVIRGDVKLENAIQSPSYLSDNVDILPSGSQTTNPAAINQNPKFEYLLENLGMHYDYVLIDTAPYGIVTDAAPIMKLVDGIVVVTRFRKTEEVELDHTLDYLHKIRANILGFAITAFDPSKSTDYYNRSSYYQSTYNDYYSHTKDMSY